jgi:4-amino-4-deoxy-L-arabinose transferase-like glycosyltransferase
VNAARPVSWRALALEAWSAWYARWLLAVLALAAVLRIVWVAYAAREPQGIHDPIFYLAYGDAISDGNGYALPDGHTAYYPIGYPAALAAMFFVVKQTPLPDNLVLATGYFQVALGVTTVALAFDVGRRLFNPAVGLGAALLLALFPNLVFHTATFLTETLFNFLVMAALLVLLWRDWGEGPIGWPRLVAFGALVGAAALVRPISLLFLPLLPVVWLLAGLGWRRALGSTAVATAASVALIVPWTVRNAVVMDAPVIISTNLGDNLCMGHYLGAPGHFALPAVCFSEEPYAGLSREEFEVERNDDNTRKAVRFAVDHPVQELKLLSRKAYHTWKHDHDGLEAIESYGDDRFLGEGLRTGLARAADIFYFTAISLGGLGLAGLAWRPREGRRLFFLLALLALAGVPLVFFGDARFHVPVLPLLVVPAAWTVLAAWGCVKLQWERERSAAVERAEGERPVPEQDAL